MRPRVMVRRLTPGGRKRFYYFDIAELTEIPAHEAVPNNRHEDTDNEQPSP